MARMFGTDGVRGVAGSELTIELAMKLGQAGAYVLTKEKSHQPTIIVGCDTRISGGMLANALMAGICSVGANAVYAGVLPTPAVAYLTRKHKVDAGVVISASHNPMEFNGIKFFNGEGYKLSDALEDEIEELIKNEMKDVTMPIGSGVGRVEYRFDMREEYVDFIEKWMKEYGFTLDIITEACKRTIQAIHQPSFEYTDTILHSWKDNKIHHLEDIAVLDASYKDKKAKKHPTPPKNTGSKFNNFSQRNYNYDQLERQLLNRSIQ